MICGTGAGVAVTAFDAPDALDEPRRREVKGRGAGACALPERTRFDRFGQRERLGPRRERALTLPERTSATRVVESRGRTSLVPVAARRRAPAAARERARAGHARHAGRQRESA